MHSKYIVTNNFQTSNCIKNKFRDWLKGSHNLCKRFGDRFLIQSLMGETLKTALHHIFQLITKSDNLQSFSNRQLANYQESRLGKDYSFLIIDQDSDRAYVGGRDLPLKLYELVMLPDGSGYAIYQVEDISFLSPDMWVASVKKC